MNNFLVLEKTPIEGVFSFLKNNFKKFFKFVKKNHSFFTLLIVQESKT